MDHTKHTFTNCIDTVTYRYTLAVYEILTICMSLVGALNGS